MTESRQQANQAALEVPNIQEKVAAAEESINSITEELTVASDRAKEARDMAQQAQKEYAEKASEVMTLVFYFQIAFVGEFLIGWARRKSLCYVA